MTIAKRRPRGGRGTGERLRGEILTATRELMARAARSDDVSIRAVADAVGVTAPAIYLHFADKETLIEAVVVEVFADLDAAMTAAADGIDEPLDRLFAYCLAFVQFAVDHPEHYRIATMERHVRVADEPLGEVDQMLVDAAFATMERAVSACIETGAFGSGRDPADITFELWTVTHGLAALMVAKPYLPWGDKIAFATRTLRSAAIGHAVGGLFPVDTPTCEVVAWLAGRERP